MATEDAHQLPTDKYSLFRLNDQDARVQDLEHLFEKHQFVPMPQLQSHVSQWRTVRVAKKPSNQWGTIGIVDRVIAGNGYCVIRLCDMRDNRAHVFLFGKACEQHQYNIEIGSVVGITRPTVLLSKDLNAEVGLLITAVNQLLIAGRSADLIQCVAYVSKDKQCSTWIDGRAGDQCDYHIACAYKRSRNNRMELASGDSGIDVRWAQRTTTSKGQIYQSSDRSFTKRKEYTYVIEDKGPITSDGKLLRAKRPQTVPTAEQNKALSDFLRGRTDPGADMIRKLRGLKEERVQNPALSKEAMAKIGLSTRHVLTEEEAEAKKRSIASLLEVQNKKKEDSSKKPRFVYL